MNQATNTNNLRKDIINILTKIDDVKKLKLIFQQVEEIDEMSNAEDGPSLGIEDGIVKIRAGVTLDKILREQDYKPISYQEFRRSADAMEWEHSLEELLANLD